MRTYLEALKLARQDATEIAGFAGGWTRRIVFENRPDGSVAARLFRTDVVRFHPDHVVVDLSGYVTPSTFDGIAAALNISRGHTLCGTVKHVPHVLGIPVVPSGPNVFDYEGRPIPVAATP